MISKKLLIVANTFEIFGLNKIFYKFNSGRKKIFAYHNVIDDVYSDGALHLDYSISVSNFKKQIEQIKKNCNVNLNFYNKKSTQITFDDGYLNQISKATKILDEYGLKGIVFCPGILANNNKMLAMDLVLYWFSYVKEGKYKLDELNIEFDISNVTSRKKALILVESFINEKFTLNDLESLLAEKYSFNKIKYNGYRDRFTVPTFEDFSDMKNRGHLLGAHSYYHYNLKKMSEVSLREDINLCGELLNKKFYNTDIFCYPYGSKRDIPKNIYELLEKNNFQSALAYGNNPNDAIEKYYVPRILLPDSGNKAVINFIASGAFYFLNNKKLFPKVNFSE